MRDSDYMYGGAVTAPGGGGVAGRSAHEPPLPAIQDLLARLRFAPDEARISLGGQRMLLLHAVAVRALRRELVGVLGMERARATLTRMGHHAGTRDATFARQVRPAGSSVDTFWVGPQLHGIEGVVRVELLRMEFDLESGHHYGEFLWHDSFEDEYDAELTASSFDGPACWMQIGYASGYTSAFMRRDIVYREVECRAMGFEHCRVIGQPAEMWHDAREDLHYLGLTPGRSTGQQSQRRAAARSSAGAAGDAEVNTALIGKDPAFTNALQQLAQVAPKDVTVLLLGETGVGKECFARELHRLSGRSSGPFVAVNCAALPDTLLEAELFGVEKGAFTGAVASRAGRFERADGGTLFLDEVTSLSEAGQAKLLRVLQDMEIERLGSVRGRRVNTRVVAACQEDLAERVADGRFRRDLYYRLAIVPLHIPALRERPQDIPELATYFLRRAETRHEQRSAGFERGALESLRRYAFPGNVRELENLVERAFLLTLSGQPISASALTKPVVPAADSGVSLLRKVCSEGGFSLPELEAQLLEAAVTESGGNLCQAARRLGISRAQLAYRLEKYRRPARLANGNPRATL
jgi:DNA-binding NtrC family response regulator